MLIYNNEKSETALPVPMQKQSRSTVKNFPNLPLRLVLVVPFVLQIVGAVGLVGYLSYKNGQQAVEDLVSQLMVKVSDRVQERLDTYLETAQKINSLNANAIKIGQLNPLDLPQLEQALWTQQNLFSSVTSICLINSQKEAIWTQRNPDGSFSLGLIKKSDRGNLHLYTLDREGKKIKLEQVFPNYDPFERPWYKQAKAVGKPTWTSIYPWLVAPTLSIAAVTPIYEATGKLNGVLSTDLSLGDISQFLNSLKISPTGQTFIIERSGTLVATSTLEKMFLDPGKYQERIRVQALNSSVPLTRATTQHLLERFGRLTEIQVTQQLEFSQNGQRYFVRVAPYRDRLGLDWLIVGVVPEADFMSKINAYTRLGTMLCLGALGVAVLLGLATARWISQPIRRLCQASQAIANRELNQTVEIAGINELVVLATAFNQMSQQLQQSQQELENYSNSLKEKVNERTQALQQEIQDRRLLEDKLRSSEAEVRAFFEAMTDIVLMIDAERHDIKIAPTNPRRLYDDGSNILDKTIEQFFGEQDSEGFWLPIRQALEEQQIVNFEYSLLADGKQIWFAASISPTSNNTVAWVARDISDVYHELRLRKQAEAELRQSEERWQLALKGNNDGIWDWNVKTHEAFYSVRYKEMLGYSDSEMLNTLDAWKKLVHPDDLDRVQETLEANLNQTTPYYVAEYRMRCKDGSYKWILGRGQAVWDEGGNPIRMVGSHTDITERKQQEQALQLIVEGTAAKIGSDFFHSCVRYLAEVLQVRYAIVTELMNATPSRVRPLAFWTGETWNDDIEYDLSDTPCENVIAEKTICYYPDGVQACFPNDRELIDLQVVSYLGIPLVNSTGKVLGHLAVLDVKPMSHEAGKQLILRIFAARAGAELERKRAEEALQRRAATDHLLSSISRTFLDQRIETAIHFTLQAIAEFTSSDRSAIVRYSEPQPQIAQTHEWCAPGIQPSSDRIPGASADAFPWLHQQLLSGNIVQIPCITDLPPAAASEQTQWQRRAVKSALTLPMLHAGKAVGLIALEAVRSSQFWSGEDINLLKLVSEIVAIAWARHEAEIAQQQAIETALGANRAKSEFLANMSHELRTPLTAILGLSEVLRDEVFGPLTAKQHQKLATIEQSGKHLLELINDVLDLAKIESGKMELHLAPTDIQGLCDASLAFVRQQAHQKQIKLTSQVPPRLGKVIVDERRMRQVLINLLSNAVKFTPEAGEVWIEVEADAEQEVLRFAVVDTGIGITPEDSGKLFQPFVQLESSFSRRYRGTGLGLALVRQVVELHGGSVRLESEVGEGSRFTVSIPWRPQSVRTSPSSQPTAYNSPLYLQTLRGVLIVEDSAPAAEQVARYLEELGVTNCVIHPLGTGVKEEALRLAPDAVVLDLQLPDRSGWDVLAQLKADSRTQNIPVLIISVVDEPAPPEELGVGEYLVKPFSRSQFQIAWRKLLLSQPPSESTPSSGTVSPLVLLAEDNEANISTIVEYLEVKGYRVALALNGKEAVQLAKQLNPELILMDIQMPEMDGLEATRQIRSDRELAQMPIIALTSLAMPGDREKCLEAGVNDYMAKPVSLKKLVEAIAHYLKQTKT